MPEASNVTESQSTNPVDPEAAKIADAFFRYSRYMVTMEAYAAKLRNNPQCIEVWKKYMVGRPTEQELVAKADLKNTWPGWLERIDAKCDMEETDDPER